MEFRLEDCLFSLIYFAMPVSAKVQNIQMPGVMPKCPLTPSAHYLSIYVDGQVFCEKGINRNG